MKEKIESQNHNLSQANDQKSFELVQQNPRGGEDFLESNIKNESEILKNHLIALENELKFLGGPAELEAVWVNIDKKDKDEIINKINKFIRIKEKGIEIQLKGESFWDPRDLGFGEWRNKGNKYGRILGPLAYLTGIYPAIGGIFEAIGGIPRLYGYLRLELEKRKLYKRIEKNS